MLVQGNIAYNFGFYEGYFLFDLFFKKFSNYCKQSCNQAPEIVPFLVIPGKYDYS